MKTKFMQAFEEVAEQIPPVDINELSKEISKIDSEVEEVVNQLNEIKEASSISDSVDSVVDTMQASVDKEKGLDESSMAIASTAMEHFFDRLNYAGSKVRPSLAVENFSDSSVRLSNTKLAIESLTEFNDNLKKSLTVCKEDFSESVSSRFNKSNGQVQSVLAAIDHVSSEFDKKGPTKKSIPSGNWSKALGSFKNKPVLGKDVLERVKKVKQTFEGIGVVSFMNDLCSFSDKIVEELGKSNPEIENEDKLNQRLKTFDSKAEELYNLVLVIEKDSSDTSSDFAPLTKEEKNELVSLINAIGNELNQFAKGWKKLSEKIDEIKEAAEKVQRTENVDGKEAGTPISGRVIGTILGQVLVPIPFLGAFIGYSVGKSLDSSRKTSGTPGKSESVYKSQASGTKQKADNTLQNIIEIDGELVKLCFSATEYIEKSTV